MSDYEYSQRGFRHWPTIQSGYGADVKIYESSSAEDTCLWLSVDGSAAHLNPDQVVQVVNQMMEWLNIWELVETDD